MQLCPSSLKPSFVASTSCGCPAHCPHTLSLAPSSSGQRPEMQERTPLRKQVDPSPAKPSSGIFSSSSASSQLQSLPMLTFLLFDSEREQRPGPQTESQKDTRPSHLTSLLPAESPGQVPPSPRVYLLTCKYGDACPVYLSLAGLPPPMEVFCYM